MPIDPVYTDAITHVPLGGRVAKKFKRVTAKSASMSSKHFGKSRIPMDEAMQRAVINIHRGSGRTAVFGKPTEEVRVVSTAPSPKLKLKTPLAPRPKSPNSGGNIRAIRQDSPGLGLPWVPGPTKKLKAQPTKAKTEQPKKKNRTPSVAVTPHRKVLLHEGQPRFEGGIRFVQGGLPFLGRR